MESIKGILPPIMAETPKRAIKFFCFGSYNAYLSRNTSLSNAACGSIAGLGSGLTEGFFITPFERVKILLQNQKGSLKGMYIWGAKREPLVPFSGCNLVATKV